VSIRDARILQVAFCARKQTDAIGFRPMNNNHVVVECL